MKCKVPDTGHYLLGVYHIVDKHDFSESDADESGAMGLYKDDGREILLDTTQPEYTQSETHLHECIHGIDSVADLGLKHWQICILSLAIHDLFRNQLGEATECDSESDSRT